MQNPYQPPRTEIPDQPVDRQGVTPVSSSVSATVALRWGLTVTVAAFVIGAVSRLVRPYVPGRIHYDALVALGLLIGLCLVLLVRFRHPPLRQAMTWFQLSSLGLWAGFAIGWTLVHRSVWSDFVSIAVVFWLGTAATGAVLLKGYDYYRRRTA